MNVVKADKFYQQHKVLVTRDIDGCASFERQLHKLNANIVVLKNPLLSFEALPFDPDGIDENMSVITTSHQAKKYLEGLPNQHYTIGMSAKIDNASTLLNHIKNNHDKDKLLLYVRGADITLDFKTALQKEGFIIDEQIVYKADMRETLDDDIRTSIQQGEIAYICFFSARTAKACVKAVQNANLESSIESIKALCLSTEMISCLESLPWKSTMVPEEKTLLSMVKLIDQLLEHKE